MACPARPDALTRVGRHENGEPVADWSNDAKLLALGPASEGRNAVDAAHTATRAVTGFGVVETVKSSPVCFTVNLLLLLIAPWLVKRLVRTFGERYLPLALALREQLINSQRVYFESS